MGLLVLSLPAAAFAADSDKDGFPNGQDGCSDAPETVNGYADLDGCPDELGLVRVVVKDLEGAPVPRAKVRLGDLTDFTGADGTTAFTEVMPGSVLPVRIEAAMFAVREADGVEVDEGESSHVFTVDWLPVPVHVRVFDASSGAPVDAVVRVDGPGLVEPQRTDKDGLLVVDLRPGAWTVQAYADHYPKRSVDLALRPATQPYALDIELSPTWTAWTGVAVAFPVGEAALSADAKARLDALAVEMLAWTGVDVEVLGWTDPGATDDLDDARADAVVAYLREHQVPADRLYATGKGTPAEGLAGAGFRVVAPGEEVSLPQQPVLFEARSAVPTGASEGVVDDLAARLRVHERDRVLVLGHAADDEPVELAATRAEAVVGLLVKRGVGAARLQTSGADEPQPGPGFVELLVVPPPALKGVRIEFGAASSDVPKAALETVRAVALALQRHPTARIKVRGVGTPADGASAETIGVARAEAVIRLLVENGARRGALQPANIATKSDSAGFVAFELASLPLTETVAFEPASAALGPGQADPLERARRALLEFPSTTFEVRGFAGVTDAGSAVPLDALARSRADAVTRWLVARGVEPGRITTVAMPISAPSAGTPAGRVELVVTSPL